MAVATLTKPAQTSKDYAEVLAAATAVMHHADIWMVTPNSRLGFLRPDKVIEEHGEEGKKLILNIIASIREGFFT